MSLGCDNGDNGHGITDKQFWNSFGIIQQYPTQIH